MSVLDCPFEDEDEDEATSPFRRGLARMEGNLHSVTIYVPLIQKKTLNY